MFCFECNSIECTKMNETVKTFLLLGDKYMPEMHLKQPRFTVVLVVHLPERKKELKNL